MQGGYLVAAGTVDITPTERVPLAGYATIRKATFENVADPLEANVLVIRDGAETAVFVSLDLMYVGEEIRRRIADRAAGHLPVAAVFVNASHTHFAPPTDPSLPVLGRVTPAYVSYVGDRVGALLTELLERNPVPATAEYREGNAHHAINRRARVFGVGRDFPFLKWRYLIRPNPSGPRDETIRMLTVRDATGVVQALCWSYACHPVGFPLLNDLSAEYPGVVRAMLRQAFGPIPIVFWQGFSGDIRPRAPLAVVNAVMNGTPATSFPALTSNDWRQWSQSLGTCVVDVARSTGRPVTGVISHHQRSVAFSEFGPLSAKSLVLQEIGFGMDLRVCGVSAEVSVNYVAPLTKMRAPAAVIPVGCVGAVAGYLPTSAMVREGGYEASGFLPRFGVHGRYRADVSDIVETRLLAPIVEKP